MFQHLDFSILCAIGGWYSFEDQWQRDTDWFACIADGGGYITATAYAEYDLELSVMRPADCNTTTAVYQVTCQCEIPGYIEFLIPVGMEFWVRCRPAATMGPVYEFDYNLFLEGIVTGQSPVNEASWGEIKTRYRR